MQPDVLYVPEIVKTVLPAIHHIIETTGVTIATLRPTIVQVVITPLEDRLLYREIRFVNCAIPTVQHAMLPITKLVARCVSMVIICGNKIKKLAILGVEMEVIHQGGDSFNTLR